LAREIRPAPNENKKISPRRARSTAFSSSVVYEVANYVNSDEPTRAVIYGLAPRRFTRFVRATRILFVFANRKRLGNVKRFGVPNETRGAERFVFEYVYADRRVFKAGGTTVVDEIHAGAAAVRVRIKFSRRKLYAGAKTSITVTYAPNAIAYRINTNIAPSTPVTYLQ